MTWGKVDDKLHGSVKWRRATKAARALWTTALSWCSDQENDGTVPADMLRYLDGTAAEAASLVSSGLWNVTDSGWSFHNWSEYNPDAASRKARRAAESEGGKRGNHARWHLSKGLRVRDCEFCYPTGSDQAPDSPPDRVPESGANPPDPTRPVPSRPNKEKSAQPAPRRSPETTIPDTWQPNTKHQEQARELRVDLDREARAFRNHAHMHDRKLRNWDAGFRAWLDKANTYTQPGQPQRPARPRRDVVVEQWMA